MWNINIVQFNNSAEEWPQQLEHQAQVHAWSEQKLGTCKASGWDKSWRACWTCGARLRLARAGKVTLGNRGCTSDRSTPSGSPVALLASLSYLDGDGVDEPELEQNNSRLRAATHEAASPQLCPWPVIIQTGCQTHSSVCVKSASTHSKWGALIALRPCTHTITRTHPFLSPLLHTCTDARDSAAPHCTSEQLIITISCELTLSQHCPSFRQATRQQISPN